MSKCENIALRPIAHIENGFVDKFGIPRQSRDSSDIESRIVFEPAYRNPDAIRGIEGYSHLWLIWGFDQGERRKARGERESWHATVRPPRLGGNVRMGVFATRSPFRPNPLGLTSVRLLRVEEGPVMVVSGADLLNGTPIFDIKPYLSYSDCHPDAVDGFAEETKDYRLEVVFPEELENGVVENAKIRNDIREILSQDPRPAYQEDPERIYKLDYAEYKVAFRVNKGKIYVLNITKSDRK